MFSKSQGKTAVVTKKSIKKDVKAPFDRRGLPSATSHLRSSSPVNRKRVQKPDWISELQVLNLASIPDLSPRKVKAVFLRLLASPNIAGKRQGSRQSARRHVGNAVLLRSSDAVPGAKETKLAMSVNKRGNGRYCYVNPYLGGVIAVSGSARKLICSGAQPRSIAYKLTFSNPESVDVYYHLKECVAGMARACRTFKVPVINDNISLHNKTKGKSIYPEPVIDMVGLINNVAQHCTRGFKNEGDLVYLLGDNSVVDSSIGASEYLVLVHGMVKGNPHIDLEMEKQLQRCCLEGIRRGLIKSACDCCEGGLAIALAESCASSGLGFTGSEWDMEGRLDAVLFGEAQSRIVVSIPPRTAWKLQKLADRFKISAVKLGVVSAKRFVLKGYFDLPVKQIEEVWRGGIKKMS